MEEEYDMQLVERLARAIRRRVRNNYDTVIAITGNPGEGKSTLAILLAYYIEDNWPMKDRIILSTDYKTIYDKIKDAKKRSVLIFDEAAKTMYKRDTMTRMNKNLNKLFNTIRQENKCFILCIPEFQDLDSYFRNGRVHIWIHIIKRGTAFVFKRNKNFMSPDKWNHKDSLKYMDKYVRTLREDKPETYIRALKRVNSFEFFMRYPNLPDRIYKQYLQYFADKKDLLTDEEDPKELIKKLNKLYKNKYVEYRAKLAATMYYLNKKSNMNMKKIATMLDMKEYAVKKMILKFKRNDLGFDVSDLEILHEKPIANITRDPKSETSKKTDTSHISIIETPKQIVDSIHNLDLPNFDKIPTAKIAIDPEKSLEKIVEDNITPLYNRVIIDNSDTFRPEEESIEESSKKSNNKLSLSGYEGINQGDSHPPLNQSEAIKNKIASMKQALAD